MSTTRMFFVVGGASCPDAFCLHWLISGRNAPPTLAIAGRICA